MLTGTVEDGTPAAQSGFSGLANPGGLAGHDPTTLAGGPRRERLEGRPRLQHRIDRLEHGAGHRHAPGIRPVLLRHPVVEAPKLGRAIACVDRPLDEDPAQPLRPLFG